MEAINDIICEHFEHGVGLGTTLFGLALVVGASLVIGVSLGYI